MIFYCHVSFWVCAFLFFSPPVKTQNPGRGPQLPSRVRLPFEQLELKGFAKVKMIQTLFFLLS